MCTKRKYGVDICTESLKRTKCEKILRQILEIHPKTKLWLVEWDDQTRTWEGYDAIKNTLIFKEFIERLLLGPKITEIPSYIT